MEKVGGKMKSKILLLALLLGSALTPLWGDESLPFSSQEKELRNVAPKVFIDCSRRICDLNYIRTEITFVNYVRDRQSADIHIIITRQRTGSGGYEYTFDFIGQGRYEGRDASLKYHSSPTATEDEIRQGVVKILKQGLVPYISETPLADYISVVYERKKPLTQPEMVKDKWNYWVFSIGIRGKANMEELSKRFDYSVSLSANRTTEAMKFRFWANTNLNERRYIVGDEEIISQSRRKVLFTQYVKSLGPHLSAGISGTYYSSTYDNADAFIGFGPAIEYNIFPYEQANRRELRIQYTLNYTHRRYIETTIFDKDEEDLFSQQLQVVMEIKEPWGSAGLRLAGSNFLHDFSKNKISGEAGIYFRVFKGLSFNVTSSYSRVRDQLGLPKGGASKEEILLELKRLATSYDFRLELGFNYRFGSIYSNVVNPRFGNR